MVKDKIILESLLKDLYSLPFSIPVSPENGEYMGLICPTHKNDRFICLDHIRDFLLSKFSE